ncbi:MAG: hypothetical protein A2283_18105 [Lentisphaerae bacterium RIFOXYA12_FULL_48_11]|nr:MAG: hypothetical protein A2283_18105 [Lentisphaerae bacterium RIFOXYA12_FULL_48_11]
MAQPITIKKKPLTIKTIKAMPPPSAVEGAGEEPVEPEVSGEVPVSASPVAPAKGVPFLVSTICALISVVCFIVILVFQMNANKDFGRLCYDQPGSGIPSVPGKVDVSPAPAVPAPAPAEEKPVAAAPAADAAAVPAPAAPAAPEAAAPAPAAAPEAPVAVPAAPAAPENK